MSAQFPFHKPAGSKEKNGLIDLELDDEKMSVKWHQPGAMVRIIFDDEKKANSFKQAIINEFAGNHDAKLQDVKKARIENAQGEGAPNKKAVCLTWTQFSALRGLQKNTQEEGSTPIIKLSSSVVSRPNAPGGPKIK